MNTMTAAEKLDWIKAHADKGRTVYIHTMTRVTKLTPKIIKEGWALKVKGESLYLIRGKGWVCIDFNPMTAQ